jgi:galactokinase
MNPSALIYHAVAPGRVNLLGEHLDYNGGQVMPAAIDRAVRLEFSPRADHLVHLAALDLKEETEFSLDHLAEATDVQGDPLPVWARYPAGVAWAMQKEEIPLCGLDGQFTSDIPMGSGLSSSAAVELAFSVAWNFLSEVKRDAMQLALISQKAENRYVGVNCGIMDQFASACGVEDHVLLFDTRSLEWQPLPLPENTAIVVADSTMRRSLTTSVYNDRRGACERAVLILKKYLPDIQALRDVTPAQFEEFCRFLPEDEFKRARHVVYECARVTRAERMLREGDAKGFGSLMVACHNSLRDYFEVSIPELNKLVEIAVALPGCIGARLTGAGFGGCTVNLVQTEKVDDFIAALREGYQAATGMTAPVYLCRASRGARVLEEA